MWNLSIYKNNTMMDASRGTSIAAQIAGFHDNTFCPSSGGMGIKLKNASQRLMRAPQYPIVLIRPDKKFMGRKQMAMATFMSGPAKLIRPP
jgi:hypothetical protein